MQVWMGRQETFPSMDQMRRIIIRQHLVSRLTHLYNLLGSGVSSFYTGQLVLPLKIWKILHTICFKVPFLVKHPLNRILDCDICDKEKRIVNICINRMNIFVLFFLCLHAVRSRSVAKIPNPFKQKASDALY